MEIVPVLGVVFSGLLLDSQRLGDAHGQFRKLGRHGHATLNDFSFKGTVMGLRDRNLDRGIISRSHQMYFWPPLVFYGRFGAAADAATMPPLVFCGHFGAAADAATAEEMPLTSLNVLICAKKVAQNNENRTSPSLNQTGAGSSFRCLGTASHKTTSCAIPGPSWEQPHTPCGRPPSPSPLS